MEHIVNTPGRSPKYLFRYCEGLTQNTMNPCVSVRLLAYCILMTWSIKTFIEKKNVLRERC